MSPRKFLGRTHLFLARSSSDKNKILDVYNGGASLFFAMQEEERRYARERSLESSNDSVVGRGRYRSPSRSGATVPKRHHSKVRVNSPHSVNELCSRHVKGCN